MERLTRYDSAEYLEDEGMIVAYLKLAVETGDAAHVADCCLTAAKARLVNQLVQHTGLGRDVVCEVILDLGGAKPDGAAVAKIAEAMSAPLQAIG
jgi:probable addiction module antidote protein